MNTFFVKKLIANVVHVFQIDRLMLKHLNRNYHNDYIRVINYHGTPIEDMAAFDRQLSWLSKHFQNVDRTALDKFMSGQSSFTDKPGILLTFDDGLDSNYSVAKTLLEKHGFTGCFFVSSELVGKSGYMTWEELASLLSSGHIIGCHTATHWRINKDDSAEKLVYEVADSKLTLEKNLNQPIEYFAWCGGEEEHYTAAAAKVIKRAGYKYSFMTNSAPTVHETNVYQIERTNVESGWSLALMLFQICGWMDKRFAEKKKRVEAMTDV